MRHHGDRATVAPPTLPEEAIRWQPTAQAVLFPATTTPVSRNHPPRSRARRPRPPIPNPHTERHRPAGNRAPGGGSARRSLQPCSAWAATSSATTSVRATSATTSTRARPVYNDIYQQGFAAGKAQGTQQGQAQGAAQGAAQGEQAGLEQGKQQGVEQGTSAGATAALGGFTTWEPGAPYVVKVKAGSDSVPYQISSRTQMEPDIDYALCKDDPSQVCTVKEADAATP